MIVDPRIKYFTSLSPTYQTNTMAMGSLYKDMLNNDIKAKAWKCSGCDEVYYITAYKETKGILGFFKKKLVVKYYRINADFCLMSSLGFG